ncbi:hypothetical protein BX600DRAFT_454419 [Xylariales sp. PMI_506]|nr:hypothetical protein BX600DRAFT_454419 [Xylariales sp. PMI_506]
MIARVILLASALPAFVSSLSPDVNCRELVREILATISYSEPSPQTSRSNYLVLAENCDLEALLVNSHAPGALARKSCLQFAPSRTGRSVIWMFDYRSQKKVSSWERPPPRIRGCL